MEATLMVQLRKVVLRDYDRACNRTDCGPCGAIAVALSRLGFGTVVSVKAISEEDREDCFEHEFLHFAVLQPSGLLLDVALPDDFKLLGYIDHEVCKDNLPPDDEFLGQMWGEEEYTFWEHTFREVIRNMPREPWNPGPDFAPNCPETVS